MAIVRFDLWVAEPVTEILPGGEDMFELSEGCWSSSRRYILEQLRGPGVRLVRAGAYHAAHNLSMQEKIIGAGRELDQAVGRTEFLSRTSCRSIHS
jgi:hypothetical protein